MKPHLFKKYGVKLLTAQRNGINQAYTKDGRLHEGGRPDLGRIWADEAKEQKVTPSYEVSMS